MLSHESDDGVWRWLLFRVAICFSLRVVRFSFYFDTLLNLFLRLRVCVSRFTFGICCNLFLVARISQLNCYALLVSLGICCVSVSVARLRFSFAFRVSVSRFVSRVSRFSFHFDIWYLFLVARISGSHITMEWLRGQLNCYAFLVSLCCICCVSCFAFRVSRFLFHFGICGKFFLVTRMCFSFHFGILTMIRSCTRWDFFKMVCKICARCCAKMVAAQDAVQDGVQDVMQDDWRA